MGRKVEQGRKITEVKETKGRVQGESILHLRRVCEEKHLETNLVK